jgi:hypothetical protein
MYNYNTEEKINEENPLWVDETVPGKDDSNPPSPASRPHLPTPPASSPPQDPPTSYQESKGDHVSFSKKNKQLENKK